MFNITLKSVKLQSMNANESMATSDCELVSPSVTELQRYTLPELELLFATGGEPTIPRGAFRGVYLRRLSTPGAQVRWSRWVETLGFEKIPFGVDFDSRAWFFFDSRLQLGRFQPIVAQSRWRNTRAVTLNYQSSRLPRPIRSILYDEVKPLSATLLLGLAGINADRGAGDHFFFALERLRR